MHAESCEVAPILNQMVFEFIEDTTHGHFNRKGAGGLLIVEGDDKQVEHCRWIRILAIGPDVTDFAVGEIVLCEKLRWTNRFRLTDRDYWITSDTEIIARWGDDDNLPTESGF